MERIIVKLLRALLDTIPFVTVSPEVYDIFEELRNSRKSLDRKVEQAAASLKETSNLISELEVDLKERSEKIKILRDEIERYSKIAEVEEDKAKVILQEVQTTLNKGKNIERWVALGINLIAGILIFILGIFTGPILSKWLNIN
jgi:predicted RNase H-like nuclease (RuvC/YqgF family)